MWNGGKRGMTLLCLYMVIMDSLSLQNPFSIKHALCSLVLCLTELTLSNSWAPAPSLLIQVSILLIPKAFHSPTWQDNDGRYQTVTINQRDGEKSSVNAGDQRGYSYYLLSALELDESVKNNVTGSPTFLPYLTWSTEVLLMSHCLTTAYITAMFLS